MNNNSKELTDSERELKTIKQGDNLNRVYLSDNADENGMFHFYGIDFKGATYETSKGIEDFEHIVLNFQNGDRNIPSPFHGLTDSDLLEIVRHRLQCFEACLDDPNIAKALYHVESALSCIVDLKEKDI